MIEPIKVQNLKDACTTRLERMILSGELKIGERLPSERDLASRMEVSRPVLHQALVDLHVKGLVQIIPRRGVFISDYRRDGSLALLPSLFSFYGGDLDANFSQSMLDMRLLLETETARLASMNSSQSQLDEFLMLLDQEKKAASSNPRSLTDVDFSFHLLIAIASGNHVYPLIINSFKDVYTDLTSKFFHGYFGTDVVNDVHRFHDKLVRAFENKQTESAVRIMTAMLKHGESYLKGET